MKKLLKALVSWMDRKWPDLIVVTKEDFDAMNLKLEASIKNMKECLKFIDSIEPAYKKIRNDIIDNQEKSRTLILALAERIESLEKTASPAIMKKIEDDIVKINTELGFNATFKTSMGQRQFQR